MTRSASISQPIAVVMGVAGSGKTTIGHLLAERLGVVYAEADSFHPPANVAKMTAGQALDDDDRRPWLAAIAAWIRDQVNTDKGGVVSCSALRFQYRDRLREAYPDAWFLHLDIDRARAVERVASRHGHFMPASLVDSQLQTLEPLLPGERGTVVDASAAPEEITRTALRRFNEYRAAGQPEEPPAAP